MWRALLGGQITTKYLMTPILKISFGLLSLAIVNPLMQLKARMAWLDSTSVCLAGITQISIVRMNLCTKTHSIQILLRKQFCGGLKIILGCAQLNYWTKRTIWFSKLDGFAMIVRNIQWSLRKENVLSELLHSTTPILHVIVTFNSSLPSASDFIYLI